MSDIYHLDYETFSRADLKKTGAYRYADDPSAEILMLAIAVNFNEPVLWSPHRTRAENAPAMVLLRAMSADRSCEVWAHNVGFEAAVSKFLWDQYFDFPQPDLLQWRCTAALARRCGFPGKLALCAKALKLDQEKDPAGAKLIKLFCSLQDDGSRVLPSTQPDAFKAFGLYCLQDVRAESQIHRKLAPFAFTGGLLDMFKFDLTLNDRGIPVNVEALKVAGDIVREVLTEVGDKFYEMTDVKVTQRAKVRQLLKDRGLHLPNMQAKTLEDVWDRKAYPPACEEILRMYSITQFAAVKKLDTMLRCVCSDGWIRGMFLFYGAGTGRWSGLLVQPQNFKRPTHKQTDLAYALIRAGCTRDTLDILWGNAIDIIASCIRNFFQWMNGDLWDADYAAIECRIVCWLSGQEDSLDEFRKNIDSYRTMAAYIYGCAYADIVNPSDRREVGKRTVLGCGFNMGWRKFKQTCQNQYGIILSEELSQRAVEAYRAKNYKVVGQWKLCEQAARAAIALPGKRYRAGPLLSFIVETHNGIPYLLLRIPSGRTLAYPHPDIEDVYSEAFKQTKPTVTFYGNVKGQTWGRVTTYGGSLLENATQAVAADLMGHGSVLATKAGYQIIALIHDQAPALKRCGQTIEEYVKLLTTLPPWAKGLPLKADGRIVPYYKKA